MAGRLEKGLGEYGRKRDFRRTPEPRGGRPSAGAPGLFVVQRHAARTLHYDIRLELGGVLKSWAVPKGPSADPEEKRLAVRVEDHPLEYAGFEGVIPRGEYGAGVVLVWDTGYWVPKGDPEAGLRKGTLKFFLAGRRLRGGYALVRLKDADGKDEWLLVKERDSEAAAADGLWTDGRSVLSGRSPEEILQLPEGVWGGPGAPRIMPERHRPEKGGMPESIRPELATLAAAPAEGPGWLHEIKLDGYRLLARIKDGRAALFTRSGNDWTGRFPEIARALSGLAVGSAWLDGEVVSLKPDGTTSFESLQAALSEGNTGGLAYIVFDIVYYNGYPLFDEPLYLRKLLAKGLLPHSPGGAVLRYGEHVEGAAQAFFEKACAYRVEGVISKRRDSAYAQGRTSDWLKCKCRRRQEFVICGYTDAASPAHAFGALIVGVFEKGALAYSGRVGTGFSERSARDLLARLKPIGAASHPFKRLPPGAAGVHWVEPRLVCEAEFAEWTRDGVLRQASFQGLKEDKPPGEVVREEEAGLVEGRQAQPGNAAPRPRQPRITNPERVFYPEDGLTKRDLLEYYESVYPLMLPHIAGRPLTLVRCPEGHAKGCFFQKHSDKAVPDGVKRVALLENDGTPAEYLMVDTPEGLSGLAQMAALEIHAWGSRHVAVERPDRMTFDMDPDEGVPHERLVEAAYLLRALLDELGLVSFVKATGGKGLHVVAPLRPERDWEEVKAFSRAIAELIAANLPGRFTSMMTKSRRAGRIFIDYMRNIRGATAIEPYSTRARKGAPIAAPLAWDELMETVPAAFTLSNMRERIREAGNPWEGYMDVRQSITDEMKKRLSIT